MNGSLQHRTTCFGVISLTRVLARSRQCRATPQTGRQVGGGRERRSAPVRCRAVQSNAGLYTAVPVATKGIASESRDFSVTPAPQGKRREGRLFRLHGSFSTGALQRSDIRSDTGRL